MRKGALETPSVQSVDRVLTILEAVAKSTQPVPLAQLTDLLGINQSSVFRLANTLKRRGFLANPNTRKSYVLGPAIWRMSRNYDWGGMLISICHEHLKALGHKTGETAHLAVREGRQALFIDHHASTKQIVVPAQTGALMPLYCTAHGKALISDYGLAELKALSSRCRSSKKCARR
jgi:DNA-binding IclR family transcriptional regulator